MTQYLLDTLLWTGALIALVLLLRRPVARHFGAQAAYALWALPLLRLAVPPITLPAWLRPAEAAAPLAEMAAADPAPMLAMQSLAPGSEIVPVSPMPAAASVPPPDWLTPLLVLWLAGAAIFLIRRFALYFAMRRELLEGARPVGEAGRVRLVETPATLGPVAFGVFDKVVALPQGFMAQRDRHRRDLAIAHELAHHRGHDLLANILVQPLFAAHWFNPLGWTGWTALRRDQEAACDARVVAARSRDERAAYADIIAGFAATAGAAPRLALAAPMACPVLGDKSIIHRLRSLTMADISPRRKFAGRALLAGAALALPLTASISYAESAPSQPEPPAAPAPPSNPGAALPPPPPVPPMPPEFDADVQRELDSGLRDVERAEREVERAEREVDRVEAAMGRSETSSEQRTIRVSRETVDGRQTRNRVLFMDGETVGLNPEERAALLASIQASEQELRLKFGRNSEMSRDIARAIAEAEISIPRVVMACSDDGRGLVTERRDADGRHALFVCHTAALKQTLLSLKNARKAVAAEPDLSRQERAEALRSVDQAIAEVRRSR